MIISLRERMGLLFLAFFLLVAISVLAMFLAIEGQQKDALVINLAGRQRMLLQAMTRHALELEKHPTELQHRQALTEAAATFESTLQALEQGGPAPYLLGQTVPLPPPQDPVVRERLAQVRTGWGLMEAYIETLLSTSPGTLAFGRAVEAVEAQSFPLVQAMDEAVRAFERAATAKVQRLRFIQVLFLVAAVALVLLGYGLTYRTVIRPLRVLQRVALEIGRGERTRPVPDLGRDESGQLAQNLELMRRQLYAARENLEAQVAQRTRELEALYDVSREISSRLDIRHVLRSVTDKARELLGAEVAALCLLDRNHRRLYLEALSGPDKALKTSQASTDSPLVTQVLGAKGAVVCDMAGCGGWCTVLEPTFQDSHLAAPLRIGDRVIGALCVGSSRRGVFSTHGVHLLTKLADSAAIALENARLYEQAERVAALEERQRLAAEIHDGLAQSLSYLGLKVDRATELIEAGDHARAVQELQHVRAVVGETSRTVRRSIADLQERRPGPRSLQERLAKVVDELKAAGAPLVELNVYGETPLQLPPEDAEQVVRVVQEALTNACRHAVAHRIQVRLSVGEEAATVVVEDDGCGFDPNRPQEGEGHFGLSIMRARAARLRGQLTIDSAPWKGTRVVLRWPLVARDGKFALKEWEGGTHSGVAGG
ncbi:Nitrate/nitrite sensor protein NarX [bacterium HR23]|nr:Nitrate/nitrite sensor protein NarX [bacterium HR23]